jgi:uncharacterized protein YebE (UPF0316 family)
MGPFFTETLGFSNEIFSFVILPLLIFIARIGDVSINTIRIIYMLGGRRVTATLLGFFEAFIWLMAISQIFEHLNNWVCYVAYPGGFAMGVLVGMIIEERIAYGKVVIRIITRKNLDEMLSYFKLRKHRFTIINGHGPEGDESVVFTVIKREYLDDVLQKLKILLPTAFYTVEGVKAAAESGALPETAGRYPFITRLKTMIRS